MAASTCTSTGAELNICEGHSRTMTASMKYKENISLGSILTLQDKGLGRCMESVEFRQIWKFRMITKWKEA